jgi:4,5-dihydroxyphthalate decarboxylase
MGNLKIRYAGHLYDRTWLLRDGTVRPSGIDLTYLPFENVLEVFDRMINGLEFEASELSLLRYSTLVTGSRNGPPNLVAIPVFPSRIFRHGFIFVNKESKIIDVTDLESKRIGCEFNATGNIWIRGLLQHEYGVRLRKITWVIASNFRPSKVLSRSLKLIRAPDGADLSNMLERKEIDALIAPEVPSSFYTNNKVARLFSDFRKREIGYYKKTGIFPIMHTVVIQRHIGRKNSWVSRSLFDAFESARKLCYDAASLQKFGQLQYALVWLMKYREEENRVFGGDPFSYGLKPNEKVLRTFLEYAFEQKLLNRVPSIEELFPEMP